MESFPGKLHPYHCDLIYDCVEYIIRFWLNKFGICLYWYRSPSRLDEYWPRNLRCLHNQIWRHRATTWYQGNTFMMESCIPGYFLLGPSKGFNHLNSEMKMWFLQRIPKPVSPGGVSIYGCRFTSKGTDILKKRRSHDLLSLLWKSLYPENRSVYWDRAMTNF